jgi:hypothetical protein
MEKLQMASNDIGDIGSLLQGVDGRMKTKVGRLKNVYWNSTIQRARSSEILGWWAFQARVKGQVNYQQLCGFDVSSSAALAIYLDASHEAKIRCGTTLSGFMVQYPAAIFRS